MIKVLPYKGKPLEEIRPAYFLKAFGEDVLDMRIFSFGRCNYSCPYCKRNGYNKENLDIEWAVDIDEADFMDKVDEAIDFKEVVRLSGGDPVCYPEFSRKVLKYVKSQGGITSIAHNGSGPEFVKSIAPYLDFASIDFKANNYQELAKIAGISEENAKSSFERTVKTIDILSDFGVYTDIRTCVFDTTKLEDLQEIGKLITQNGKNDNKFWTLRTFSNIEEYEKNPKSKEEMQKLALDLSSDFSKLKIGLRDKWAPGGFSYYLNGQQVDKFPEKDKRLCFGERKDNKGISLVEIQNAYENVRAKTL